VGGLGCYALWRNASDNPFNWSQRAKKLEGRSLKEKVLGLDWMGEVGRPCTESLPRALIGEKGGKKKAVGGEKSFLGKKKKIAGGKGKFSPLL